jgi:hypothetical protein
MLARNGILTVSTTGQKPMYLTQFNLDLISINSGELTQEVWSRQYTVYLGKILLAFSCLQSGKFYFIFAVYGIYRYQK